MCGIAGFCDFQRDLTTETQRWNPILSDMRKSIDHRGGDQNGAYLLPHVGLTHARLSIRDLEGAVQPMTRTMQGAAYTIVYNGEIYNTDELVPDLHRRGFVFETSGDTEVILYSYMAYGPDFVSKLNGIFAFAIWDERENRLLLYRDRVGVKPLFYTIQRSTLVFGSELKALFCHPQIIPRADEDSYRQIFGIGPARTAGCGVFQGIDELEPGYYGVFTHDGFRAERYWTLQAKEHRDSYARTVETVSYLVRDAVTRQMVADIPVCSFLSGGIDSSIVTAIASDFMQQHGETMNTFSFDFTGNDRYFQSNSFQPTQDRPFVDRMLSAYPLNHTYLECNETDLVQLLPVAMQAKDLPGMADVDASMLYFCRLVKQHNKVVLTGECADEIFGGYPWFYREELLNTDGFPWSHDLSARTVLLRDSVLKELDLEEYNRQQYLQSLEQVPRLAGECPQEARRREVSFLNIRWFMTTLLDRMDRMSMSCGLEARVPFADHRIVEYLYNVPWSMKYQNGVEKALLRDACHDLLPPELLNRKKSPYPKPYNPEYERLLSSEFSRMLKDRSQPIHRFLDPKKAADFLSSPKEYGKPWFGQLMAGQQMLAYILQVNAWMRVYHL